MLETFMRSQGAKRLMVCLLIVIAPFFFLGGPSAYSTPLFKTLWDCGHLCFFIILVAFLDTRFRLDNWRAALFITLAVFIGGGLIEIIQAHTGRDGNWGDLLRDLIGTWLALFWLQPPNKWVWSGRLIATLLLMPNIIRILLEADFQWHSEQEFPRLASFESAIEMFGHKGQVERTKEFPTHGDYALKIHLTNEKYSGVTFDRLFNDWSGYQKLKFDVYNPQADAFIMSVRINDVEHQIRGWINTDRFNGQFVVSPGWNHVVFSLAEVEHTPAQRVMDMHHISHLVIYAAQLNAERDIYLDNVHLE